jgi:hypothetical protein
VEENVGVTILVKICYLQVRVYLLCYFFIIVYEQLIKIQRIEAKSLNYKFKGNIGGQNEMV